MVIQRIGPFWRSVRASPPLAGFIKLYNVHLKTEGKTPKTVKIYNYVLRLYSEFFREENRREPLLGDFTGDSVRLFLAAAGERPKWTGHPRTEPRPEERVSGATIHQYTRSLKSFGAWLAREGITPANPLATVRLPKLDQRELVPLTREEEVRLLESYDPRLARDCRVRAILMTFLDCGIRAGELLRLKVGNVDFDGGFLRVLGKRKERSIPFGQDTELALRTYLTLIRPAPARPGTEELFLTVDGYPLTESALRMIFERVRKRTGIARLHPHLLRHTYALRGLELEIAPSLLALQQYLGHSSPTVTERYAHAAASEKLKRARHFAHIDALNLRARRLPAALARTSRRRGDW